MTKINDGGPDANGWNFDISQAPKGHPYQIELNRSGKVVTVDSYHYERIIAAGSGGVVTLSKWLPDEGRWEMFSKEVPPLAWMPWPDHPLAERSKSQGKEP